MRQFRDRFIAEGFFVLQGYLGAGLPSLSNDQEGGYSIILNFAKLSNNVLSPKLSKRIAAFLLAPSSSILVTFPNPNLGCSMAMPSVSLWVLEGLKSGLGVWSLAVVPDLTAGLFKPTKPFLPSLDSLLKVESNKVPGFLWDFMQAGSTSSRNLLGSQFNSLPKQSPFFLQVFPALHHHLGRKEVFFHAHNKNLLKFQAFGGMYGH